jgi:hypothetical protein
MVIRGRRQQVLCRILGGNAIIARDSNRLLLPNLSYAEYEFSRRHNLLQDSWYWSHSTSFPTKVITSAPFWAIQKARVFTVWLIPVDSFSSSDKMMVGEH